jgi:hypothetical protein
MLSNRVPPYLFSPVSLSSLTRHDSRHLAAGAFRLISTINASCETCIYNSAIQYPR